MKGIQQNGADFIAKQSQEVKDVGADCLLKCLDLKVTTVDQFLHWSE